MRNFLRWTLILAVALCIASATLPARQTFTSSTSLLTLDVSVLDRDGNPVTGLTPEDFIVTLNNEKQPVRTMVWLATERHSTAENARVPSAASSTPAAPAVADVSREPDPKLLVILVDDKSIYPTESKGLFVAAERFVDAIPSRDWVGLASTSGLTTVNPSLDRASLIQNLQHAFGGMDDPRRQSELVGPYIGLMDALEADASGTSLLDLIQRACAVRPGTKTLAQLIAENSCASDIDKQVRTSATFARVNTRNQLDTYAAVIQAMASAPGVKQLVILTGGIALRPSDSLDFIPVAKAAAAAGVQITMLMEEPDPAEQTTSDQRRMLQQAETLAEMSGGQLFHVIGQADRFYQRILTSSSAVYRIGVELGKTVPIDGNYKVSVTVKRPGARVLASRYAAPPAPTIAAAPDEPARRARANGESLDAKPTPMLGVPTVGAPAPHSETQALLARAAAYLQSYERAFSVVVSEESYLQEMRVERPLTTRPVNTAQLPPEEVTRTLHSDVLQASIGSSEWVAFRDVYNVNGKPVRDRDERLQTLFVDAPGQGVDAPTQTQRLDQARRILAESSRYNLGSLQRDINVPTMALMYLRGANQSRSQFKIDGRKEIDGVSAVILEFKERVTPTITRSGNADLPATGRFWIEPQSGRVLRTEISIADRRAGAKITVTYGAVPKLTVWVPILMSEEYTGVETIFAKATYSNFRQFGVSVAIK